MDSYSGSVNLSGGGGGERSHGNTVTSTNSVLSGVRMPGMAPSGMGMLLAGQSTIGKQPCRAAAAPEIDVELDDRRVGGGPMKLPRTDAFPCPDLKMHVATAIDQHQQHHHHYIVRNSGGSSSTSSGCLMSEGRLAVAPTNSNASDGILFPHDGSGSIVSEGRFLRSDSVLSAAGARSGLPFQVYHYKPAGMPLSLSSMGGMGVGREMGMGMGMGMLTAVRPPFSPSQWQELEHQALIFKYMMAGVTVPPDLLLPIRKSLLSYTAAASHQHHPGLTPWTSFQIGYGGNVDPEPGRCRRTDGKKWRCSRDVVPDQKYCERHMHRGRHRGSRKPVEGQTATATATATPVTSQTCTNSTAGASSALSLAAVRTGTNLPPPISINSQSHRQQHQADQNQSVPRNMSVGMSFGGNGNQFHQYQLLVGAGAPGTAHKDYRYVNGVKAEEMDEHILFSETSGSTGTNHPWRSMAASKATGATPFSQAKINSNGSLLNYNSTSPQLRSIVGEELGLLSEGSQASNFQTNPAPAQQQQYSFMGTVREQEGGQPLRHFFDEWPRVRARDPWSSDVVDMEEEERSKRSSSATQLSISIPMASSDFSATNSTSSPRGKLSLSPLKLSMSRDGNGNEDDDPPSVDPVEMGLAVGMNMNLNVEDRHRQHQHQHQHQHQDHHHPQSNWIPGAWENPMGMLGPLAEVLQSSTTTPRGNNNPGLNLMNDIAWNNNNNNNNNNNKSVGSPSRDSHSQSPPSRTASSPTGVLQKTFGSLTDSINSASTSKTDSSSQIASSS